MSFDLVLFGGTGDLAWRKLIPALFQAHRHGSLPTGGRIIAVAREGLTTPEYRELIRSRFQDVALAKRPAPQEFENFARALHYLQLDLTQPEGYADLASLIRDRGAQTVVMYMAISPALFEAAVRGLVAAGLNGKGSRLVLEKPLGRDLASNQHIDRVVRSAFDESQVFRIDHYLGKPSVQNLSAMRFANALFEPIWRREHISDIQICLAEELGVEQRGAFYDTTGALRDMVQNHALQLLCAIAMEPPVNADANSIRDEKLKVLRCLKPWTPESLTQWAVRGQYTHGVACDRPVQGYLEEEGVNPNSRTETYVAMRAEIANWRWAGVPFYIRTGKRLARRDARIVVNFREAPHALFGHPTSGGNRLVIHLQPKDGLELHLLVQGQGQRGAAYSASALTHVHLDLDFDKRFGSERVGAYERLLLDAIEGRLNLFVRSDEQEAAWRWVEPVLSAWDQDELPLHAYAAGTWGPSAASIMIAKGQSRWSEEC